MSRRRRRSTRNPSVPTEPAARTTRRRSGRALAAAAAAAYRTEALECRVLLSSAFDITQLTNLRADPNFSGINGHGIGIADLDTGVFAQNPDLKNNIVAFYNAVEQPLNSPIDPNFLQDAVDNNGHGSHTSGTAASSNPNIGVAYGASLVDVKVLPDPGEAGLAGDPLDRGLQWVALHASQFNIKVVNMSLGFSGVNLNFTPALDQIGFDIQQLQSMGITVVSSSGNSYAQFATPGASIPAVESTISAGNSFSDNGAGQFDFSGYFGETGDTFFARQTSAAPDIFNATSQRSTLFNQLVAPGTDILSTWNSPSQLFNTESGTSMSAPFISGTVALMQQAALQFGGNYLQPSQVLQILRNTSDPLVDPVNQPAVRASFANGAKGPDQPLPGTGFTYDRVNDYRAIQAVKAFVLGGGGAGSDLNNTIATATATQPLNGATSVNVFGNIGQDGSVIVGNNDVDLYKITLQVQSALTIQTLQFAGGVTFTPTVRLFDSLGNQLAIATGTGVAYPAIMLPISSPLATGTYYVGVSSAGNDTYNITNGSGATGGLSQGDYQLQVTLNNPDPHGVPAAGTPLNLAGPTSLTPFGGNFGTLPSNTISDVVGQETDQNGTTALFPNGDVRFFQVVAPDSGELLVDAAGTTGNVIVGAFDSNFNAIGSESSSIIVPVTAGQTYYLGVTTPANAGFNPVNTYNRVVGSTTPPTPFDLTVAFTNGDVDGTVVTATPSPVGTPITQVIGGTDNGVALLGANGGNKDADFYAFTVPSSGVFHATVSGAGGFTPVMTLWNSTNSINGVQRLADAPQATGQIFQQVTAGQVVVVSVTGLNNQSINGVSLGSGAGGQLGTYTLSTAVDPPSELTTLSNNSILNATPTPLTLNTPVAANIGLDGNLYIGPNDIDVYSFVPTSTREYQFATDTSQDNSAQTVLRVFDAQGNQIAVNQAGSATSTNSVVQVPLIGGQTYYIGVSGVGPQAFTYNPLTGAGAGPGLTGPYSIMATDAGPFQRTIPFQQGQVAKFTDANGHKITVTLNGPGRGQLTFLSTTDGANVNQVLLNGSDNTSTLTIRGATALPSVIVNGALGSLNARQDDLTGDLAVTGSLGNLQLSTATGGHSITVGTGGLLNLIIGTLTDESLVSAEAIGTIRATQWTVSGAARHQITAPFIRNLNVRGAFDEDVSVGTLVHANVGALSSSAVRVQTSIASFVAGSAADSEIFVNVNPALTTLPATPADFVSQGGSLGSIRVRGAFSDTQIGAWTIGTVTLNDLQPSNSGKAFGITANRVSHLRVTPAGSKTIALNNVFAPFAQTSLGGDAVLRIIG